MGDHDGQTSSQTGETKPEAQPTAASAQTDAAESAPDEVGGYLMTGGEEEEPVQTFFGRG